jgi:hypothetical protein
MNGKQVTYDPLAGLSDAQLFHRLFAAFSQLSALIRLRTEHLFEPLDSPLLELEGVSGVPSQGIATRYPAATDSQALPSSAHKRQSESSDLR